MISVKIVIDNHEVISSLTASGHAVSGESGNNIICAAFTVLVRTAVRLFEGENGIELSGSAVDPGGLDFCISRVLPDKRDWAKGVTDFLLMGIKDLETEFPDECSLILE